MARSRAKQGNRKHRRRVYRVDEDGLSQLVKDEHGNAKTIGIMHPTPGSRRGEARRAREAAELQHRLEEKRALRELEERRRASE